LPADSVSDVFVAALPEVFQMMLPFKVGSVPRRLKQSYLPVIDAETFPEMILSPLWVVWPLHFVVVADKVKVTFAGVVSFSPGFDVIVDVEAILQSILPVNVTVVVCACDALAAVVPTRVASGRARSVRARTYFRNTEWFPLLAACTRHLSGGM
jgi:hypothetical protein